MIDTNNFVGNKDKLRTSTLVSAQGTRTVKTATGSVLSSVKSGDEGDKKNTGGLQIKFKNPVSDGVSFQKTKSNAINFIDQNRRQTKHPEKILSKEYRRENNLNVIGTQPKHNRPKTTEMTKKFHTLIDKKVQEQNYQKHKRDKS